MEPGFEMDKFEALEMMPPRSARRGGEESREDRPRDRPLPGADPDLERRLSASSIAPGKAEEDLSLVDRICEGDGEAFEVLVNRYGERIFRLVHGIVNDWHLSEDVVQEVFILIFRKLRSFDRRSALLTWIYRVSVNAALKARRRWIRRVHVPLEKGFDAPLEGTGAGRELEMREIGEKLLKCLPLKLRVVVLLREWEGLGYEEIGRVLRCSRGAVEQRLHRAMVELRRVWRPAARKEWLDGL